MHSKVKLSFVFSLTILLGLFFVTKASARQLTPTERKKYGQNNIIFYVPCDTEADCTSDASATDPGTSQSGDPDTIPGSGAEKIVNLAMKMSWPDGNGQCRDGNSYVTWYSVKNPAGCQNTVNDYARGLGFVDGWGGDINHLQDCGKFVGYVLKHSVDKNARSGGTYSQVEKNFDLHPENWQKVSTDGQEFPMGKLKPGDIVVGWVSRNPGADGHIKIYIGEKEVNCGNNSKCKVNFAQASWKGRTPHLSKTGQSSMSLNGVPYKVYRYIGNN